MKKYTQSELEAMRVDDIRKYAVHSLSLAGVWRKRKDEVIEMILDKYKSLFNNVNNNIPVKPQKNNDKIESSLGKYDFSYNSHIYTDTENKKYLYNEIACGTMRDNFPVVGKSVEEIHEILGDVLNIPDETDYYVNGRLVQRDYVLKSYDVLEFIKPVGRKG